MNNIRFFQILVPLLYLAYLIIQFNHVRLHRKKWKDLIIPTIVATAILLFALVPDKISSYISSALDIKDSVNALLVSAIGILFILVFRLFELNRRLRKHITNLTVELSIKDIDKDK